MRVRKLTAIVAVLHAGLAVTLGSGTEVFAQANAQLRSGTLDQAKARLSNTPSADTTSELGYVLADGVVFTPAAGFETGYNSNPDAFFTNAKGSPYGLTESSGVLGFLRPGGATTVAVKGSFLQYNDDIFRPSRWDAGAAVDNSYTIGNGITTSFGIYALKDSINLVPSNTVGGYGQAGYSDADVEAYTRVKTDEIDYLGRALFTDGLPEPLVTLLTPSQFDVRRTELQTNLIYGPSATVGVYGEVGGADLNYVSQTANGPLAPFAYTVNRNATETWAVAGLRFNVSQTLRIDAGARGNHRSFEVPYVDVHGRVLTSRESAFFDGRAVWVPMPNLQIVADVDRKFVEPITAFAVVGDQTTYQVTTSYRLLPGWEIGTYARYRTLREAGDNQNYRETSGGLSTSYQLTPKASLYATAGFEHTLETFSNADYDRIHIGAGTKIKF